MDILAVKRGDTLVPYRDEDREALNAVKDGQPMRVTCTRRHPRSVQQLKLYWSGLIGLAMEYWTPTAGMITPNEEALLQSFARHIEKASRLEKGALEIFTADYVSRVKRARAEKIAEPAKTKEALHRWIKEELGYWDAEITPTGYRKELKSIAVESMNQEEFDKYYKEAFDLIWNFVMFQVFESKEQVQEAVMARLLEMG